MGIDFNQYFMGAVAIAATVGLIVRHLNQPETDAEGVADGETEPMDEIGAGADEDHTNNVESALENEAPSQPEEAVEKGEDTEV